MENYSISELIYYYSYPEHAALIEKEIQFDLSPLIDLALATNDRDWFFDLVNRGEI